MTRVYCTPVEQMSIKALKGEHRQIEVLQLQVSKVLRRGTNPLDPTQMLRPDHYKLGQGHLRFFYDKIAYALKRQIDIEFELRKRKITPKKPRFSVQDYSFPLQLLNDWDPPPEAIELSNKAVKLYEDAQEIKLEKKKSLLREKKKEMMKLTIEEINSDTGKLDYERR